MEMSKFGISAIADANPISCSENIGEDVQDKMGIKHQEQVEKTENSLRLEGRLE